MATILMIEDLPNKAIARQTSLEKAGHEVVAVVQERLSDFIDEAKNHLADRRFDFLLLDMNLHGDQWGGASFYNWLCHSAFRNHWDHTIVTTMYWGGSKPRTYDPGTPDAFILRIFAETAGIPQENILPAAHGQQGRSNHESLVDRIAAILTEPPPARCPSCGERRV